MRLIPAVATVLMLSLPTAALAQEWVEFASREDRFTCNFPAQPKLTTMTFTSEYGAELPARVYTANTATSKYSMTVVDYSTVESQLTARAKSCPPGAETCAGGGATGLGYWRVDKQGAIVYATWKLIERPTTAKITHMMWNFMDLVEGQQLQLTNTDKSRTFASIYMHEDKLFIMEATVPPGYPEPGLFQQSLGWLDENGVGIRYSAFYLHGGPKPAIAQRGRGTQGRISADGADDRGAAGAR